MDVLSADEIMPSTYFLLTASYSSVGVKSSFNFDNIFNVSPPVEKKLLFQYHSCHTVGNDFNNPI